MEASRHYCVAEHVFGITAAEDILSLLTNYVPFEVEREDTLFHLTVLRGEAPEQELQPVFTDKSDEDMPRIEVYRCKEHPEDEQAKGWMLCVSMYRDSDIVCRLMASEDFRAATLYIATDDVRFAIDNAAMLLFAFTTVYEHTLEMHASVIKREGWGYLFLGKSGTGKSTHSRQWMHAFEDAELLNDDNPILRFYPASENGKARVVVYGSPWSGKTPCYKNDCAPVRAIVKLSQAPQNNLRPLRLPEAYAYMLSSASGLKIVPEMMDALYETIAGLIQTIQVYGLECLPNTEAAVVCYDGTQDC